MNLFLLHINARQSARYHCDKHVVKMVIETAQILCTVHWIYGGTAPYKATHRKHPMVLWAGESLANYKWTLDFGMELAKEYSHRYGRTHATEKTLLWLKDNEPAGIDLLAAKSQIPLCMPELYRLDTDPVLAHRMFYVYDKAKFCRWTKRAVPTWFAIGQQVLQSPTATVKDVQEALAQNWIQESLLDDDLCLKQNEERDKMEPPLVLRKRTSTQTNPLRKRAKTTHK
jgi:hypothetical protein